uniref:Uncharacterized protein n=1 Tax=Arundo donax TaxID=35708 RepID=A0A0A9G654_ARUDO
MLSFFCFLPIHYIGMLILQVLFVFLEQKIYMHS